MKVIKESFDIYTHKVTVEMTEAEWMAIKGFAAYAARATGDRGDVTASRLAGKSDFYWNLNLDWSRLFTNIEEK